MYTVTIATVTLLSNTVIDNQIVQHKILENMGFTLPRVSNFLFCIDLKTGTIILGALNLVMCDWVKEINLPIINRLQLLF